MLACGSVVAAQNSVILPPLTDPDHGSIPLIAR